MLCAKPITLVDIDAIRPNEEVYAEQVDWLVDKIADEKIWRIPLTLDKDSLSIMDGHHRRTAALRLQLKRIPCLLLDYHEVDFISTHPSMQVTPLLVREFSLQGRLFPPKSTRHVFYGPLPTCNISLSLLQS
ncbi:hypothetical protein [Zobellella sp. An-6]|uniref:hypothetical protein n=1 Tax=Zobellella sp. An-6 TaxID=3400218 RepID=UPI0040426DF3